MKTLSLPDYTELSTALNQTTLKLHPSQVHGLIAGILCAGKTDDAKSKSENAWENLVTGGKKSAKMHALLQTLYDVSENQLREFLFDFQLILPPDDEPLSTRAEALTLWCQGMLTGLKLVQIPIEHREAGEVTEAINDLIEIAKMNYEHVVASEEDEAAYVELVEYVRMAVILIYQDLHEVDIDTRTRSSHSNLH